MADMQKDLDDSRVGRFASSVAAKDFDSSEAILKEINACGWQKLARDSHLKIAPTFEANNQVRATVYDSTITTMSSSSGYAEVVQWIPQFTSEPFKRCEQK